MTARDLLGLVASYAYASTLIAVAELLRRVAGMPQQLTRKLVHIGAGMWVLGALALFDHWEIGIIPFASFILINYLLYRYRVFAAMDIANSAPGTVYFAMAVTLLFGLLWRPAGPVDHAPAAVAGAMALTWGDALAALVGQRWGRHRYQVSGSERSWEGSAAMFLASLVAIFLALVLLSGSPLSPRSPPLSVGDALLAALPAAGAATLAEAVAPNGTDNLSVPLAAAVIVLIGMRG